MFLLTAPVVLRPSFILFPSPLLPPPLLQLSDPSTDWSTSLHITTHNTAQRSTAQCTTTSFRTAHHRTVSTAAHPDRTVLTHLYQSAREPDRKDSFISNDRRPLINI